MSGSEHIQDWTRTRLELRYLQLEQEQELSVALAVASQALITHIEGEEWQCPYCASHGGCGHAELCPFEPIETAIRTALAKERDGLLVARAREQALVKTARRAEVMMDTCAILGIGDWLYGEYREAWPGIHTDLESALAAYPESL